MKRWVIPVSCLVLGGLIGIVVADRTLRGQASALAGGPKPIAAPAELTSYRDVVRLVLPAVVSIESRVKTKVRPMGRALPDGIPEEFRRFFEGGILEEIPPQAGFGSGFLVDPNGLILTNLHVVDGADQVEVTLKDGRKFTSRDIKGDRKTDLALVRIDARNLPFLTLGDSDAMEIGDRVLAVGAPFGLTGSVTHGIISAKGRNNLNMNFYEDYLQTDAAINPGNSGGPLVNLEGKVVGINTAIKSRSGGFQGVGLAIASNLARTIKDKLATDGVVKRGYLGVQIKELSPEIAERMGVKQGVVIGQVFDGSPAAKAGFQAGDVVTAIASKEVKDSRELQQVVAGLPLQQPVEVRILREGKPKVLSVTIEEQPEDFGTSRVPAPRVPGRERGGVRLESLGLEAADLTPELAEQLGLKEDARGVVVTAVDPEGAAAEAGLRRGMVIAKVEGEPVKSASALKDALAKAPLDKGVVLQVQSARGGVDYLMLKSAAAK
jgi:serine protease Do